MDVLGLEDTFSSPWPWARSLSPWPWPRSQQVFENVLSSARGQHYFLIGKKEKTKQNTTYLNLIVCQFVVSFLI